MFQICCILVGLGLSLTPIGNVPVVGLFLRALGGV